MSTLHEVIHENVREGELYEKLDRYWVRCFACGHCCKIPEGQPGVCKVRDNRGGTLFVPWGYVGGVVPDVVVVVTAAVLISGVGHSRRWRQKDSSQE
jgi:hypothetical protein